MLSDSIAFVGEDDKGTPFLDFDFMAIASLTVVGLRLFPSILLVNLNSSSAASGEDEFMCRSLLPSSAASCVACAIFCFVERSIATLGATFFGGGLAGSCPNAEVRPMFFLTFSYFFAMANFERPVLGCIDAECIE